MYLTMPLFILRYFCKMVTISETLQGFGISIVYVFPRKDSSVIVIDERCGFGFLTRELIIGESTWSFKEGRVRQMVGGFIDECREPSLPHFCIIFISVGVLRLVLLSAGRLGNSPGPVIRMRWGTLESGGEFFPWILETEILEGARRFLLLMAAFQYSSFMIRYSLIPDSGWYYLRKRKNEKSDNASFLSFIVERRNLYSDKSVLSVKPFLSFKISDEGSLKHPSIQKYLL